MTSTLYLYNEFHYGDCIFVCVYFYNIREYLKQHDIHIVFYINPQYIPQILEFIPSCSNIRLESLDKKDPSNNNICTWIGNQNYVVNVYSWERRIKMALDVFLAAFFTQLSIKYLHIPFTMTEFIYEDPDLLDRYHHLDKKYQALDILIINSDPQSAQYHNDETASNEYFRELHSRYKIVTTKKIEGIPCTLDGQLTLKSIAAISTHAKIIMAINTGPIVGLFNRYTLDYVRQFYTLDNYNFYDRPKFRDISKFNDVSLEEIESFLV